MTIHYQDDMLTLHHGTAAVVADRLTPCSVRTIVTSPPYFGLRDYGHEDQIGGENSVADYVTALVETFRALRPALTDDGTLWLNLGDSYNAKPGQRKVGDKAGAKQQTKRGSTGSPSINVEGLTAKNLLGIPWRVAFALQDDGWILRSDIIWAKPNPMPESVTDRPTKAHEYLFLFAKSPRYYYDADAIREPTEATGRTWQERKDSGEPARYGLAGQAAVGSGGFVAHKAGANKRTVWSVSTVPFPGAHFAAYPPELIRPCILAGSERGDTVLDPFSGSGTTGMVATQEGRRYIGIDVNSDYLDLSLRTRFHEPVLDMTGGIA